MKKNLFLFGLAGVLCALAPMASGQELQLRTLWEKKPGDYAWLGGDGTNTERGMAYNPVTGHLLVPSRQDNVVYIIEAETGDFVGGLDMSGVSGGTFLINKIGVADDGAIYVGNMTLDSPSSPYRLYRWANESALPVQVFAGDPGDGAGAPDHRFGDSLAVRGAGQETEILIGTWQGTILARLTPNQANLDAADSFSAQVIPTSILADHGRNIVFGEGDVVYVTRPSAVEGTPGHLYELELNVAEGSSTVLRELDGSRIARGLGPIGLDVGSNFFAGLRPFSHDILIYRYGQLASPETISAQWTASFSTTNSNGNGVGEVVVAGDRIYGLHTNNGLLALELGAPEPVAPGDFFWSTISAIRTADFDGGNPRTLVGGLGRPIGIALDAANGHIYWAENTGSRIARSNLDGTGVTTIVPDRVNPQGIVLVDGRLYWAEWARGLFSANLDGSDVQHLIDISAQGTSAVAWDPATGRVYMVSTSGGEVYAFTPGESGHIVTDTWSTGHYGVAINGEGLLYRTNFSTHVIDSYALGSGQGEPLHADRRMPLGIGLTPDGARIVWAERHNPDQTNGHIYVANADGSGSVTTLVDGEASPFGLAVMPSVTTGGSFSDWIAQQDVPTDQRGPQDDPDGDGIPNLLEYALGGAPGTPNRDILPFAGIENIDGSTYLSLSVMRNELAEGVQWIVEVSSDLVTWESGPEHTTTLEDNPAELWVRDNTPITQADRRFIRLRVVEQ